MKRIHSRVVGLFYYHVFIHTIIHTFHQQNLREYVKILES